MVMPLFLFNYMLGQKVAFHPREYILLKIIGLFVLLLLYL